MGVLVPPWASPSFASGKAVPRRVAAAFWGRVSNSSVSAKKTLDISAIVHRFVIYPLTGTRDVGIMRSLPECERTPETWWRAQYSRPVRFTISESFLSLLYVYLRGRAASSWSEEHSLVWCLIWSSFFVQLEMSILCTLSSTFT